MTLWKIVQRHIYDLLSHKYSVIIILISLSTILVSVIHFGEVWMTWSQEKYETVFNSFSDNIVGKSLQSKLCQNVPIDVVYTWVNGSDPILLQQLQQYHLQLQKESSIKCPYANCAPSHILTFRDQLLDEAVEDALLLAGFQGKNASLRHRVTVENNNWTFIEFYSPELAAEAMKFMLKSNVTICHAHWTSDSTVSKTSGDAANTVMISGIPNTLIKEAGNSVHTELARHLQSKIQNMWVYAEKGLAVVEVESSESVSRILQLLSNVTIGGNIVNISKAYLILEIPLVYNSKDFSPSRFEDKEELRYSLRSLERFAPWVRHVYLVTNGQIPYWLDMENPRLTVVTHDQIFPDPSHLPTFSSPAIESHIHRIPGLSRKFLYLNDDVMFGKEVWPDDFITNTNGQKVYLSWPVPDCSDSCPWSWVADGSCDVSCNISECSFDGGDCDLSAEDDIGLYDENRHLANYDDNVNLYNENHHESINDNLFHNINFGGDVVLEDLQDPGKKMNSLLDVLIKTNAKKDSFKGNLPFLREFDEIKYKNSNGSRNISDTDNTPPFIYKHNITSKFLLYREIKLDSKKTANQHRKNNNPQQYEEIYGGEGNNTLCMQRIPQVQEGKKENTSSDNTFIVRGSALVHQQKHSWLYNQEFGFEPRKVPAHMPHLIDIDIMESLQARFSKQWHLTSSHKVRHPHDMQFAFSYFYFLMSSKVTLPLSDIFDIFDTDDSGTWSDREIRTLLTRSYDLPLNYARVVKFENDIVNCSKELSEELSNVNVPTPPYERYQDSNLPVVSKTLVSNCKPVVDMLVKKFGDRKMYRYQVERDKHQDVSFKMLSSNITQLVSHLDDVRRDPKKFICLNDNLDPKREEDNAVARAILHDMYESLFPQPSSFELPPEFRNRFLHMTELEAWRTNKNTIRTVVYICLTILITFTLVNFFHVECRWLQRKLCQRMRQQYHRETPLVPCV
ncbi:N-acetylglucosamine-1-phosphotransferase subunits alpha/beta isoform X7 [Cryptotermes secundus]|uniref:N-acetylglucosamine-1-phosphotransferase subunits alpha/beta isoform X7 n=1 Tax=Cryptotermes secundus TaxID=105785 RepID=UPI000CD7DAC5|nr:N-acetylglucosamine-1-phosphotransferase subunits alpha/beta isoform X7 [Cryptotermes secundus]